MNAHALLTSQGWLGTGHALDSRLTDYGAPTYKQKGKRGLGLDSKTSSTTAPVSHGNGLISPLLTSNRGDSRRGIGKKAHEPQSGNEWWLKGFASALANIGKSESERSSGTSTPVTSAAGKHGGLYGYFVAGQMMKGTIRPEDAQTRGKKRKSDVLDEERTNEHNPLAVKPVKKSQTAKELEASIAYLAERDKGRKKRHERAQSTDIEQFAAVGQFLSVARSEGNKREYNSGTERGIQTTSDDPMNVRQESKEERRARRKRRKEGKEKGRMTLAEMVEDELAKLSSMDNSENDGAKKRVTRKKRRKEETDGGVADG